MAFDEKAVEQLAAEAARVFLAGLQNLAAAAAKEAELERQRLSAEALALAKDRARLEEAWSQLNLERTRLECSVGASTGITDVSHVSPLGRALPRSLGSVISPMHERAGGGLGPAAGEELHSSVLGGYTVPSGLAALQGPVPGYCSVTVGRHCFSVLPLQEPDAVSLGHDLWNHVVELPEGWEIYSALDREFDQVIASLTKRRWGAMVLGVRNAHDHYDAYWTPLFGDGSHAGMRCQEDVDWIEPMEDNARRFRMTYSGLRVIICKPLQQVLPGLGTSPAAAPPPLVTSTLAASFVGLPTAPLSVREPQPGHAWRPP
uniref:Uncharacterized protein n=1 Tax=Alexandrium monilatum TaxID=311494 RepID=A0A6T1DUE6_9DINO